MQTALQAAWFPFFFDLANIKILLVGGGSVASKKLRALVDAGATDLRLVSPVLQSGLREFAESARVEVICDTYKSKHLSAVRLVLACTGNREVDESLKQDCVSRNIFLNVVDVPELCDFIFGAVVRRGPVQLAVGTGGAAPLITAKIRDIFSNRLEEGWADLVALLGEFRPRIKELPSSQRKQFWQSLHLEKLEDSEYCRELSRSLSKHLQAFEEKK